MALLAERRATEVEAPYRLPRAIYTASSPAPEPRDHDNRHIASSPGPARHVWDHGDEDIRPEQDMTNIPQQWLKEDIAPFKDPKTKQWRSVYRLKEEKLLGQAKAYQQLLAREANLDADSESSESPRTPVAVFLNQGLKLQSRQLILIFKRAILEKLKTVGKYATTVELEDISLDRTRLSKEIKSWRIRQQELMPSVLQFATNAAVVHPELEKLYLPSDFSKSNWDCHKLHHLASVEMQLREGEANDAIRILRRELIHGAALLKGKKDKRLAIQGQERNTRALKVLYNNRGKQRSQMAKYQHSRAAMLNLGLSPSSQAFPPLTDADLYCKDPSKPVELGDSKKTDGWIWRVGNLGEMSDNDRSDFEKDAAHVQWFHARAEMERWQECVEILEEEFRRSIRGFNVMTSIWEKLAMQSEGGHAAYAFKQSAMYQKMALNAAEKFIAAKGTWPGEGIRLADHVKAARPSQNIDWDGIIVECSEESSDI
ncbi:hypothetical protein C8J56DRAFT_1062311 [Mycena floridula]|nr:hypothetical protein C8J56DRAFT_1062311 [Mycena floridula]